MEKKPILGINKTYWDESADQWFGTTCLPEYGVRCVTENETHLFGDVTGMKMLEIGCGSGHSLKYHSDREAVELWGLDFSQSQLANAKRFLTEHKCFPNLICASMEEECGLPNNYFDIVYSIYAIGWAMDLEAVFKRIASYLKAGGSFIFSWEHPLHSCINIKDGQFSWNKSYFNEEWREKIVNGKQMILAGRKISTYINALSKAGFHVKQMIEETNQNTMVMNENLDDKSRKAQMIPLSFIIKAVKL